MPRTLQEILDQQDDLADEFENYQPSPDDARDVVPLRRAQEAVLLRIAAERELAAAVAAMREAGYPWGIIGTIVGTTGEAARQRYSSAQVAPSDSGATSDHTQLLAGHLFRRLGEYHATGKSPSGETWTDTAQGMGPFQLASSVYATEGSQRFVVMNLTGTSQAVDIELDATRGPEASSDPVVEVLEPGVYVIDPTALRPLRKVPATKAAPAVKAPSSKARAAKTPASGAAVKHTR